MFRHRRRRSSFGRRASPQTRNIAIGAVVVVLIGLFVFFMRQADELAPAPQQMRVELPDAFKE